MNYVYQTYYTLYSTASCIDGYIKGRYAYYKQATPIVINQQQMEDSIYEIIHGHLELDITNPMSIVEFVEENNDIFEVLQNMIVGNQLLMGRTIDTIPTSIYSYAYIMASMLLDPSVSVDLTFGLSNVSEDEYLEYYTSLQL